MRVQIINDSYCNKVLFSIRVLCIIKFHTSPDYFTFKIGITIYISSSIEIKYNDSTTYTNYQSKYSKLSNKRAVSNKRAGCHFSQLS